MKCIQYPIYSDELDWMLGFGDIEIKIPFYVHLKLYRSIELSESLNSSQTQPFIFVSSKSQVTPFEIDGSEIL